MKKVKESGNDKYKNQKNWKKCYLIQIVLLESRLRIIFLEFWPYWLDYTKKDRISRRNKNKLEIKNFTVK